MISVDIGLTVSVCASITG